MHVCNNEKTADYPAVNLPVSISWVFSCEGTQPVKVQFQWTPSAQFAGFYAADQKGLYADEGISVAYLDGGPEIDRWASVLSGEAQFGVAGASV
jgi:ABC-type nitrate/sulfonate/bicarbonate transport system substrate-binding protein